jgi:nanoRNase/pAp phosphatase (c-di-AMP/oligoRNAs hydrolase)
MQITAENFTLLANLIQTSKKILIFVGKNPSVDSLAAAIFLEENLSGENKSLEVIASGDIPENLKSFSEKISNKATTKKLVISFNWKELAVEKVSYNLEGENFNFIVTPRNRKIGGDEVKISYQGQEEDLIIVLGVSTLSELEYFSGSSSDKPIINIGKSNKNELFGTLNFVNPQADSISAIVASIFDKGNLPVKLTASGDLLILGIRSATDNFNNVLDPATFEAAAFCARLKEGVEAGSNLKPEEELKKEANIPADWLAPKVLHSKEIHN